MFTPKDKCLITTAAWFFTTSVKPDSTYLDFDGYVDNCPSIKDPVASMTTVFIFHVYVKRWQWQSHADIRTALFRERMPDFVSLTSG